MSDSTPTRSEVLALVADGCVITAGTWAFLAGIAFGLDALGVAPMGEPTGSGAELVLSTISWLLQVSGMVIGPVLAWRLHGNRLDGRGLLLLVVGFIGSVVLVAPVVMFGSLLDWGVGLITDRPYVGAIIYAVLLVAVFLAVIVWRDLVAARTLSTSTGRDRTLRIVVLLSSAAIVVFGGIVAAMMLAGREAFEAFAFVLLAGATGAGVMGAASIARYLMSRPRRTDAVAGA